MRNILDLTYLSSTFKIVIMGMAGVYFFLAYTGDRFVFLKLAKAIGRLRQVLKGHKKSSKQFKMVARDMRY